MKDDKGIEVDGEKVGGGEEVEKEVKKKG